MAVATVHSSFFIAIDLPCFLVPVRLTHLR